MTKTDYQQKLKHIQPKGATFFVTFRLYGSIPKVEIQVLKSEFQSKIDEAEKISIEVEKNQKIFNLRKEFLIRLDALLDNISKGPAFLKENEIINIIVKELHKHDGDLYDLISYCIMPNHVHILIDTSIQNQESEYIQLDAILKQIKGSTANKINKFLFKKGQVWERESYDIYIRNEKMLKNVNAYILNNPVKAGLVGEWKMHKGTYCKYEEV